MNIIIGSEDIRQKLVQLRMQLEGIKVVPRKHSLVALWAAVLLAAFSSGFAPARRSAPARSSSVQSSVQQVSTVRTFGAYWQVGNGSTATLVLKNKDPQNPVTANITLYSATGQQQSTQVQIGPGSTGRLDLADIVKTQGNSIQYGGLAIDSTGVLSGQVMIQGAQAGGINLPLQGGYRYDTENALYAPWWLPDSGSNGSLTIFNTTGQSITVTPSIAVTGSSEQTGRTFSLPPYGSTKLALRDLMGKNGSALTGTAGTVTLRYAGPAHALLPTLSLSNPTTGFALAPVFNARHQQQASQQVTWQFPQVSLLANSSSGTQTDALTPYALLSNGTKNSISPEIVAYYAFASGKRLKKAALPVAALMPSETRLVNLSQLLTAAQVPTGVSQVALTVTHGGNPGDLAISIFAASQDSSIVLSSGGTTLPAGTVDASYWKLITPDAVPRVLNKNKVDVQTQVIVSYQTATGVESYMLPVIPVAAGKAQPLGLRQMINSAMPDQAGNKFPSGMSVGMATLIVINGSGTLSTLPDAGPTCQIACSSDGTGAPLTAQSSLATTSSLPSGTQLSTPSGGVQFDSTGGCPPVIDDLGESSGLVDTTSFSLQIFGENFNDGDTVEVSGGITATVTNVTPDGMEIDADLDIPMNADPGSQNVMVVDSEFGDSNSKPFAVGDPTPNITSVSPDPWQAGQTNSAQIFGSGFGTNTPNVTITGGGVSNVQVIGPSDPTLKDQEIDITFDIDPDTPDGEATISITSTGYDGNSFAPGPGQKANTPNFNVPVQAADAPVPVILYFGTPITPSGDGSCPAPSTASHCGAVGQKISLSSQVNTNTLISSQVWSVQGTAIAGFSVGVGEQVDQLLTFTNPTITFYWITTGGQSPASYQVQYQYCLVSGKCNSATATFSVEGPTPNGAAPVTVTPNASGVIIGAPPGNPLAAVMQTTRGGPNNPGIKFLANNFNIPGDNFGQFQWVQVLNEDQLMDLQPPGVAVACTPFGTPGLPNLDNSYPYGQGINPSPVTTPCATPTQQCITNSQAVDSPAGPLPFVNGERQRIFSATMYLEWIPNADLSGCGFGADCTIPVPMGTIPWQWEGDAINTLKQQPNTTNWKFSGGCPKNIGQPQFQNANVGFPAFGYASWSGTSQNGRCGN